MKNYLIASSKQEGKDWWDAQRDTDEIQKKKKIRAKTVSGRVLKNILASFSFDETGPVPRSPINKMLSQIANCVPWNSAWCILTLLHIPSNSPVILCKWQYHQFPDHKTWICPQLFHLWTLTRDFPGSSVVKTLHFHCSAHRFNP